MTHCRRRATLVLVLTSAFALQLAPAHADYASQQDLPQPTAEQLAKSVAVWDPAGSIRVWTTKGTVTPVEQVQRDSGETTITLATDILFTVDSSDLPKSAEERLKSLVVEVPQGATVKIYGHTDSVKGKIDNILLSTDRVEAVADALKAARGDLKLQVKGLAASEPAMKEDPKDSSTYAANRRVEIIYGN